MVPTELLVPGAIDMAALRDIEAVHRLVEAGDLGYHARDGIPQLRALQLAPAA